MSARPALDAPENASQANLCDLRSKTAIPPYVHVLYALNVAPAVPGRRENTSAFSISVQDTRIARIPTRQIASRLSQSETPLCYSVQPISAFFLGHVLAHFSCAIFSPLVKHGWTPDRFANLYLLNIRSLSSREDRSRKRIRRCRLSKVRIRWRSGV